MTDKDSQLSVTHGEEITYVWITLKELTIIMWEYIRKHQYWKSYEVLDVSFSKTNYPI